MIDGDNLQDLGEMLREAREAQALSLEEVEAQTRIRLKFLEALEEGDIGVLPSAMHAKGFLRSYAQFLNLDVAEVVALFNEATGAPVPAAPALAAEPAAPAVEAPAEDGAEGGAGANAAEAGLDEAEAAAEEAENGTSAKPRIDPDTGSLVPPPEIKRSKYVAPEHWVGPGTPAALRRTAEPPPPPAAAAAPPEGRPKPQGVPSRVLGSNLFIAAVLIVGLVAIVWWVTTQLSTLSGDTPEVAATQALGAAATEEAQATPSPSPEATETLDPANAVPEILDRVALSIDVVQRSWVTVEVDGEPEFSGQVEPGDVLSYEASQQLRLLAGNGGALVVNYNGLELGPIGERGQIVERIFTVSGQITPTPTPSLTPTGTGVPTATQRATFTPTPSPTP
ncbi:MAG TPA: RodZ domain-containing protein [Aggregatilineales bacterium]|nr:RodZ domain-containing protein [Aggregatilineales bacterium]